MISNAACWTRRLAVATSLLTGCATGGSEPRVVAVCLSVVEDSQKFQGRAAAEVELLPEGSAIAEMLGDYVVMREQARECHRHLVTDGLKRSEKIRHRAGHFKAKIVLGTCRGELSVAGIARKHAISPSQLYGWFFAISAAGAVPESWPPPSSATGASRTACTGCSKSLSALRLPHPKEKHPSQFRRRQARHHQCRAKGARKGQPQIQAPHRRPG